MCALQYGKGEAALWLDQWVNCAKQLNQWSTLMEYARATEQHQLSLDALWRLNDWDTLRVLITNNKTQVGGRAQLLTVITVSHSSVSLMEGLLP